LDAFSNPISGTTPTFSATDTGTTNSYGACSSSNASGVSTCTMTSTKAESKTLSLVTPVAFASGSVSFIAGAASAVATTITGTGPVVANGVATSSITITILDAFSNPISGTTPTFSATDTGTTNSYGACSSSNASGVSTCTMTSTKAESKTLSLVTPVAFAGSSVSFVAGAASSVTSTIAGTGPVIADGVATSSITITMLDVFSNPISGTTPTFSATDTGATNGYSACSSSNDSGVSTCTMTSTKAESKTISLLTPVALAGGSVSFIAGPATIANSSITPCAGPIIANGSSACSVAINLKDAFLNAVTGITPTISATDTGSTNIYDACTVSDLNGDSTCTLASMYAEDKLISIATPVVKAGTTVTFNSRGLNIMVPIEIIHYGLSSATALRTFDRSRTSLNTSDYNGSSVTYAFEVVGLNNHAINPYDVRLINAAGTTVATVTVPVGNALNRLETAFTPTAGSNNYRIQIPATEVANNVQIFTARIKVYQVAATSTKIYIPLVSDIFNTSSNSTTQQLDQTASLTLAQATPNNFPLWRRDDSAFADIAAGSPWTLEVVGRANNAAGIAQVSLVQAGTTTVVAGSTITFNGTTITMGSTSFPGNATNFTSGTNYELKHLINNATYRSVIFKAGLWVKLTNLKKADTWLKVAGYRSATSSVTIPNQRAMLDLASYENPKAYFEATLQNTTAGGATAQLVTDGIVDTGNGASATAVAGSTLSPAGTTRQRLRSGNIYSNLVDYDRVMGRSNRTAGTANFVIGFVIVSIDQI
ncbi:MAG: Ig-like domain-containing protein, partial [Bacteriovoracaceae bacterium]|nr:Ig-like domain-containing protein [Bacteriovoracaceae bacterium]